MAPFHKKLAPLDSLFSTFSDPYGTAKHLLLERGKPPYMMVSFISILLILLTPPLWYRFETNFTSPDQNLNPAIGFATTCIAGTFFGFTTLILRVLRIQASLRQAFAMCLYALCPIIPITLGMYAVNYMLDGNFSIAQYLATGTSAGQSVELLPAVALIVALFSFRFFLNAIRVLSNGSVATCFFIAIICSVGLYGSYLIGLMCVEMVYVGYTERTAAFFASLLGP